MPRTRRIDFPGLIHHVIVRGIERRKIFRDDHDHDAFLYRLEGALVATQCRCYAWALMSNHFHLLIRTGDKSLSTLMSKILTSYAVYFNKRHHRSGYVYQNRYKSILCQEDAYFLELIRYIHLNPVRAKIVKTLSDLDRYPWTGHSALAGKAKRPWQETEEVLRQFGARKKQNKYREFVRGGLHMGERTDLVGGGLKRSAGGWEGIEQLKKAKEFARGDERILGDGAFVEEMLERAEEALSERARLKRKGWNLQRLIKHVCELTGVRSDELRKRGRKNALSHAKGLIAYWGYHELGIAGTELAQALRMSRTALTKAIARGEAYANEASLKLLS